MTNDIKKGEREGERGKRETGRSPLVRTATPHPLPPPAQRCPFAHRKHGNRHTELLPSPHSLRLWHHRATHTASNNRRFESLGTTSIGRNDNCDEPLKDFVAASRSGWGSPSGTDLRNCLCIYTSLHTSATYMHIHMHTYLHIYLLPHTHTRINTYIHSFIRTYIHIPSSMQNRTVPPNTTKCTASTLLDQYKNRRQSFWNSPPYKHVKQFLNHVL